MTPIYGDQIWTPCVSYVYRPHAWFLFISLGFIAFCSVLWFFGVLNCCCVGWSVLVRRALRAAGGTVIDLGNGGFYNHYLQRHGAAAAYRGGLECAQGQFLAEAGGRGVLSVVHARSALTLSLGSLCRFLPFVCVLVAFPLLSLIRACCSIIPEGKCAYVRQ